MTIRFHKSLLWISAFLLLVSCADPDKDTCEQDQLDGNWQAIVDSNQCNAEQKGEAYLALGGFDYFKFATSGDQPLAKTLNLTSTADAETKFGYFEKAKNEVESSYKTGTNAEKTIFFLGSFLTLYTRLIKDLDTGTGSATAVDGKVETEEVDNFVGSGLSTPSGSDADGSTMTKTDFIQFQISDGYYIFDSTTANNVPPSVYADTEADGSADNSTSLFDNSNPQKFLPNNWLAANQVVYLEKLEDPFSGGVNTNNITTFMGDLITDLTDLENSLLALGVDSDSDSIKDINDFKTKLDNGATCPSLVSNPNLKIAELFVKNTQETSIGNYADTNLFTVAELVGQGEADTSTDSIPGFAGTIGIKMLFRQNSTTTIPYWSDASTDVKSAMTRIKGLGSNSASKNDGIITLSEVICAAELL
ncbi:MAG: hypothetical protein COB67_01410 [SAR324 cluster bacterium]|uniref:Uncharacterized protein n=1 Tax=SAR324 cluster bacterium TaxID=2024889 RepID=A0A2A4TBX1_9DELT|nr:MAG: hypothetical protein COB67_01410 [SAR324 cluster bacterium]